MRPNCFLQVSFTQLSRKLPFQFQTNSTGKEKRQYTSQVYTKPANPNTKIERSHYKKREPNACCTHEYNQIYKQNIKINLYIY